jgi:glucokinase
MRGGIDIGGTKVALRLFDEYCTAVWQEIVEYLGAGIQTIAKFLNPEVIILGGGVVTGTRKLIDEARTVMERRALTGTRAGLRVVKGRLGQDAATMGTAFMDEGGA